MYVRTWKDTEMVATSDSSTSESASNEGPEATSSETDSAAGPDATEPPASSAASTTRAESASDAASKSVRSRRSGPVATRGQVSAAVHGVRERLAAIVWIVTVVAAVILAAGALLIALDANPNNDLVDRMVTWAGDLDGPFNNMFTFHGDNAATKEALVNWGLAAVAWLVGGRIVSSIIRP